MSKDVSNVEKITKKQQKQFITVYIIGLIAFIVLVIILERGAFKKNNNDNELILNKELLNTPSILSIDEAKEKGVELQNISNSYDIFTNEIENLGLKELELDDFEYVDDQYKFVNEKYTYIATNNSIQLTRKGKEVYNGSIEDDIVKIHLVKDKEYYLEYSSDTISFKVDDKTYSVEITNDDYFVNCDYDMNGYNIKKEIYDNEWNFVNIETNLKEISFTGYFFDKIEGYSLSEDKMQIINNENGEVLESTKRLDDNETIYYTVMNYQINSEIYKDVLLVNNSQKFPF